MLNFMQQMIELDRLDRKILCELERDAHLTNIKLAERVGLFTTRARVRKNWCDPRL